MVSSSSSLSRTKPSGLLKSLTIGTMQHSDTGVSEGITELMKENQMECASVPPIKSVWNSLKKCGEALNGYDSTVRQLSCRH